jgi:phosphohistidine phosphatase
MHLYLIRHAHAVDGDQDAARPLSPKGRKQVRALGRLLRETDTFEASEIWHSPLRRAAETAALLAARFKSKTRLVEVGGLRPGDAADSILKKINDLRRPIAVIGHEPHLSALASLLVAGKAAPPRFVLKKCAALRLDEVGGGWAVRWQVSPELI